MSLIDDLKTFLTSLAVGAMLTVSINYAVVNYTEAPKPAVEAAQTEASQDAGPPYAPGPVQRTDTSSSGYGSY